MTLRACSHSRSYDVVVSSQCSACWWMSQLCFFCSFFFAARGRGKMAMIFAPFTISAVKALKDLADLGLNKNGKKSATVENLTAILNHNGVQIRPIPSDQVRFQCIKMAAVFSQQSVCLGRN